MVSHTWRLNINLSLQLCVSLSSLQGGDRMRDCFFFFQAEDGIRDIGVTGVQTCALPIFPGLGLVAALWLVGRDVASGGTSPLLLAACALGVLGAFEAVGGLGAAWSAAGGVRAAAERVRALGELLPAVTDPEAPQPLPARSALCLEGVGLRYPGAAEAAVADLDLAVPDGAKVALTGCSGAGKSSVLALALRARDPDTGRVTLGGTDLRDLEIGRAHV